MTSQLLDLFAGAVARTETWTTELVEACDMSEADFLTLDAAHRAAGTVAKRGGPETHEAYRAATKAVYRPAIEAARRAAATSKGAIRPLGARLAADAAMRAGHAIALRGHIPPDAYQRLTRPFAGLIRDLQTRAAADAH